MGDVTTEGDPIAWQEIPERTPVITSDGTTVGHVSEVLGSSDEDLFHGIEVRLSDGGRRVLILSDAVTSITRRAVWIHLESGEVRALPDHSEEHAFRLGWVGLIRKHPGWVEDNDWGR